MTATPAQRFGYIDAQRGLAALLVIWLHATDAFMQLPTPPAGGLLYKISAAIDTGRIGVILFFAISGFVIPSSLRAVGNQTTPDALRVFFIRRVFRLYPAYWVSVVAAALLGLFLMTPFSPQTVLLNLTMIQSVFGAPDVLGLYWTLRLELIFYIACALLFTFKVLQQPRWLVVGMFGGPIVFAVLPRCVHWLNPQWLNPASAGPLLNYLTEYGLFIAIMFWGALFRCWHDRAQADDTQHFSRVVLVVFILFALGICAAPLLTWMFYAYLPSFGIKIIRIYAAGVFRARLVYPAVNKTKAQSSCQHLVRRNQLFHVPVPSHCVLHALCAATRSSLTLACRGPPRSVFTTFCPGLDRLLSHYLLRSRKAHDQVGAQTLRRTSCLRFMMDFHLFRIKPHALESLFKFLAGDLGSWHGRLCTHAGTRLVPLQAP